MSRYLIVSEGATLGQRNYAAQRKRMVEELGYSAEVMFSSMPQWGIALDRPLKSILLRKDVERQLKGGEAEMVEFYCPLTWLAQKGSFLRRVVSIASFDLPFGLNLPGVGSGLVHRLESRSIGRMDLAFSLTRAGLGFVVRNYCVEESRAFQIPFAAPDWAPKRSGDDGYAYAYISRRMAYRKGLDILVHAWESSGLGLPLLVTGIEEEVAEELLARWGIRLNPRIRFMGMVPEEQLGQIIEGSRFVVSASRFEEFGQVIIDSLSLGKPVATTPSIGPGEIMGEVDPCLVSRSFSPSALARSIIYADAVATERSFHRKLKASLGHYRWSSVKARLRHALSEVVTR